MKKIGIIDYGLGNLHSVMNALAHLGISAFTSGDRNELGMADGLILPGVGAFPDAMECMRRTGLDSFVREYCESRHMLGICLGMQMLFDSSCEVRETAGLGLIKGKILRLTAGDSDKSYKIPHMGWNYLELCKKDSPLMKGQGSDPCVYFVHSYKAVPDDRNDIVAVTEYGEEICAAVSHGNVFGTQFHPEKSGDCGLMMLADFASIL